MHAQGLSDLWNQAPSLKARLLPPLHPHIPTQKQEGKSAEHCLLLGSRLEVGRAKGPVKAELEREEMPLTRIKPVLDVGVTTDSLRHYSSQREFQ